MRIFKHSKNFWDYRIKQRDDGILVFAYSDLRDEEPITTFDISVCEENVKKGIWVEEKQ